MNSILITIQTLLLGTLLFIAPSRVQGEDYVRRFDGQKPTWLLHRDRNRARLVFQKMDRDQKNRTWESIRFDVARTGAHIQLEHALPAAHVIDDVKATLWMRSNRGKVQVSFRITLPDHRDPRTGRALSIDVSGDEYSHPGEWRKLSCKIDSKNIQAKIRQLRAQFSNPSISEEGMSLTGLVVKGDIGAGLVEFNFYNVSVGPLVRLKKTQTSRRTKFVPVNATQTDRHFQLPVEFRLDRLRVNGIPFFPRVAAYHNESLDSMNASGVNVVWLPGMNDTKLLNELRQRKMWATASPPRNVIRAGAKSPSLLPVSRFGVESSSILFWNIGARIPTSAQKDVIQWLDDVRRADAGTGRPIMGDVVDSERIYSRHISMLGVSRHMVNTSFGFKQYRNWLTQKRKVARPGSFTWTWIQTEPTSENAAFRKQAGWDPLVIEPEQIRLQLYAALSAGSLGVGYWKSSRLDGDLPGAKERLLAISQLNLELELLTPWLSTGTVISQTPFSVQASPADHIGQRRLDFRSSPAERAQRQALLRARAERLKRNAQRAGELEAAVIRSEYGMLLLPIWYQTDAQFAPGKMTAKNANIIVHGVSESALAWEITTTGIRSLVRKRVTGGIQITLPQLDQTAAIILTSNRALIEKLRKKIAERKGSGMAAKSARLSVELAREKMARVKRVNGELSKLGIRQPDSPQLLAKAAYYVEQAEAARKRGLYNSARLSSGVAMQHLRILQRAHWSHAVQNMSSPVSSPHTICFQSLPDHWKLVAELGRSRNATSKNLLRSGNFEDFDTMIAEGWQHRQNKLEGLRAAAELYPSGHKSQYSLRLVAAPKSGTTPPASVAKPPVVVKTPPITVRSGQIVQISGWVRVASSVTGSFDGGMLYDSIAGLGGAIRIGAKSGWRRISLIRPVLKSGEFSLTFSLTGMGDLLFDDFKIVVHRPAVEQSAENSSDASDKLPNSMSPLRFLNRLPKIPSIPGFRDPR